MKFRLFVLIQLFFFPMLKAETVLCWNSPADLSDRQVNALVEQISFHDPDLVCLRAENVAVFEEILSPSHPYLFYDEGLLIASKNPIAGLQFSPLSLANEGVLEFITADKHIYIPIFNDPNDQVLWDLTYEKIWNDHDPLPFVCTDLNALSQLQAINFISNRIAGTILCGGPRSANVSISDDDEKVTATVKASVSTKENSNGGTTEVGAKASVSRDKHGNVTKEASIEFTYTPSAN